MATVGVLHPGAMGAAVGAALVGAGHTVLWDPAGRSAETAERARAAGLEASGDLAARCEVLFAICPPDAAVELARSYAAYEGVYVDANAIAPETAAAVAATVSGVYVDGGIVGPPPEQPGTTRLYLSGAHAAPVAALFAGSPLEARVLEERRADGRLRAEDGLRRVDQGLGGDAAGDRADRGGARRGRASARRMGAVSASTRGSARRREARCSNERLALDGRDARDRGDVRRRPASPTVSTAPRPRSTRLPDACGRAGSLPCRRR